MEDSEVITYRDSWEHMLAWAYIYTYTHGFSSRIVWIMGKFIIILRPKIPLIASWRLHGAFINVISIKITENLVHNPI